MSGPTPRVHRLPAHEATLHGALTPFWAYVGPLPLRATRGRRSTVLHLVVWPALRRRDTKLRPPFTPVATFFEVPRGARI